MIARARPDRILAEVERLRAALAKKTAECVQLGRELFDAEARLATSEGLVSVLEDVVRAKARMERA